MWLEFLFLNFSAKKESIACEEHVKTLIIQMEVATKLINDIKLIQNGTGVFSSSHLTHDV